MPKYSKEEVEDPSYTSNIRSPFPFPKGEESLEQPKEEIDPESAKTLARDEEDVLSQANVIRGDRLRHARPRGEGYKEPGDEEGLPPLEEGKARKGEGGGRRGKRGE